MIEIDGASGGGQMLRSSLAFSLVTGEPFRMENVRGRRPNPGLKRQHLEAVRSAARLADAELEGLEQGSTELEFSPGTLRAESFTASIGTAGSTTLLLDTLLPVTTHLDASLRVDVKGGTDVKWSPTASYWREVKLPLLRRFDVDAELGVERTGFYPAGGGKLRFESSPYSMQPLDLVERGRLERFEIYSKASRELEEQDVADRQAGEAARLLKNSRASCDIERSVEYVETDSPGSSLLVKAVYGDSIAGFDALGEQGKRAEKVAKEAVDAFNGFHASGAAVDRHMADQLVVFLAIAGGTIKVPELTSHVTTSLEVAERFGMPVEAEQEGGEIVLKG